MKRVGTLFVTALALVACGGDDAVSVDGAWSRSSAPGQTQGVVYFDLTVADDDTLVGASVPRDVAEAAEIHEVVTVATTDGVESSGEMSDDMSGEMSHDMEMSGDAGGMDAEVRMQEMPEGLALAGGETVSFEPGSYHVMLPGLVRPLEAGDEFELTLDFATADDVTVSVEVADDAP